jgi:hypothetical protein
MELLINWTTSFRNCDPVADRLRSAFPYRWVRFHSLPDAKRYPDSEGEYAILLDRHNSVMAALARVGENVVLLTTEFSDSPMPARAPSDSPGATWWRTVKVDDAFWHIYRAVVVWEPHRFDPLIRLVAQDVTANVMICDPECEWLLHPYDGGMDVILGSSESRDILRERFKPWLSPHADGL